MEYKGYEIISITVYGVAGRPVYAQTFIYKGARLVCPTRSEARAARIIDNWIRKGQADVVTEDCNASEICDD